MKLQEIKTKKGLELYLENNLSDEIAKIFENGNDLNDVDFIYAFKRLGIDIDDLNCLEDDVEWYINNEIDNGLLDVEIIYFGDAMEYLSENDFSLQESLEIASEWGFKLDDLNSIILASLLARERNRETFYNCSAEIEALQEKLIEKLEQVEGV